MPVEIDPSGRGLEVRDPSGNPVVMDPPGPLVQITSPGGARATFYPEVGFNLVEWWAPQGDKLVPIVHCEPDVLSGGSGTRSGIPILFPFPNRIAGAQYEFEGREYHLQPAHEGDPNAIHGFCAKAPWRDYTAVDDNSVAATFRISRDAPDRAAEWPGDLELRITFTLTDRALRIAALVSNVGDTAAPFGLGYHPYFTSLGNNSVNELLVECRADRYWVLQDSIPTGETRPVSGETDLRSETVLGARVLDDVLTGLRHFVPDADGLKRRAVMTGSAAQLSIRCDENFRDLVVFTPANRKSFAIEPYTCPTDAVHLAAAGKDVGWRVLQPGDSWRGIVEFDAYPR